MRKTCLTWLAALTISSYTTLACGAANIQRMVIFGDSLSDNGNTFALTRELHQDIAEFPVVPDPDLYWFGRFSDGPVWNEFLAGAVGFLSPQRLADERQSGHYLNYAYGGAWAETYQPDDERPMQHKFGDAWHTLPPSLESQIDTYLTDQAEHPNPIANDLIFIWIGGNDYLNQELTGVPIARLPDVSTNNVLTYLRDNLQKLQDAGAKHIVLLGLPDLGRVPNVSLHDPTQTTLVPALTELSLLHNQKLLALVNTLKQTVPAIEWSYVDINALFLQEFTDATQRADVFQRQHHGNQQRADVPCLLEDVDPDPSLLKQLAGNPILALTAGRVSALKSPVVYRRCDLHAHKDQASSFDYADNYAAGGIFFDHIHPLTQVHAKIALHVCEQLFASGYRFLQTDGQYMPVSCSTTSLTQLMAAIDSSAFPTPFTPSQGG